MRLDHHKLLSQLSPLLVRALTGNAILTRARESVNAANEENLADRFRTRAIRKVRERVDIRIRQRIFWGVKQRIEARHTLWE